jgi:hypothetical protein
MYRRLENHFGRNRCYSYVMWVEWKIVSVHSEILLIAMQEWCTVCAECTIGLVIILDAMDQVEAHFDLFGDSVNLDAGWAHGLRRMHHEHGNLFAHTRWYS